MRAAITIIYNSIEDLTNKGFSESMVKHFDYWIIVEGSSKNGGSTGWCNSIKTDHSSTDGTLEFIQKLEAEHSNVRVYSKDGHYASKDEQFNKGIEILKTLTDSCYLWQVDSDEHWRLKDLEESEQMLSESGSNVAEFQFNHYVTNGDTEVVAVGDWGSGTANRLWLWNGELFERHGPAVMQGQTKPVLLPQKFEHYSYCFESKVRFKSQYYKGHENVYRNWKRLPSLKFPCHISQLFGRNTPVGRSNTNLYKIEQLCANAQNQEVAKEAAN